MIEQLVQLLVDNLSVLLETRSVFVYIALMENTSYSKRVPESHPRSRCGSRTWPSTKSWPCPKTPA